MTSETRTMLELKDIKAIEFECNACHTKIVYSVDKYSNPPTRCSYCPEGRQWIIPGSEEWEGLSNFGKTIKRALTEKAEGFTVRIEIVPIPTKP